VEVYNSINNFRKDSSLRTWVHRIALNKSLEHIRKGNRNKRLAFVISLFDDKDELQIPDFKHPGVKLESKELASILFKALVKLPEKQRTALR